MNKHISTFFTCLMFFALNIYSQVYPVSTQTQVSPPYPQSLSGFVDQMANKINLQITVNDATLANYPVKLRMVLRSNTVTITTSASYISSPIYINGGEPLTLNSSDLADLFRIENLNFSGYSKARYNSTGQLPDGVYQLSFEVVDYARNYNISSSIPAFIYIYISDAPILNLPLNKKKIDFSPQQNIGFNWTFRHSPFSRPGLTPRYIFEMWEVYPENLDPNFVVRSTEPIYTEELTGTSLNYTVMHPLLISGRTYAWRVRVTDPDGITAFKNDGYSDVSWFKYGINCTPPRLALESTGSGHISVAWETGQLQSNYTLRYRPSRQEEVKWYSTGTTFMSHKIENLRPNTEYIIEVEGNCGSQPSGYSDPLTVTTDMNLDYQCGGSGDIPAIENQEKITRLLKGDKITAGDFQVEIFRVESSNGTFSGKGFVLVPMFNFLKLEADLENIVVNTDYQLIDGKIKTVYNLNNSLALHISDLIGNSDKTINEENDFAEIADVHIDAGDSITSVTVSGDQVVVETAGGNKIKQPVSPGQVVAITAPSGGQYVVDGSTQTVYTQGTPDGVAPGNKSADLPRETESTAKYKVGFLPAETQFYGFDMPGENKPEENYNEVDIRGVDTRIPWKSLEAGRFDKLVAKIEGTPADSVFYSRESASMVMVAPTLNDNTKQLMVTGQGHEDTDELYAWYTRQPADSSGMAEVFHAGSVSLISYEKQTINLCLVGINGSVVPNADYVEKYLNEVYKQAVIDWKVSKLEGGITVELPRIDQKTIDNTDADNRMDYTSDMKLVIRAMKENASYDKHTYYLFLADNATDANIKGYMPLKGQFGFIFKFRQYPDSYSRTIAHEVAHGTFRLRHTFSSENKYVQSQGSTDNLMDYTSPSATGLYKYQWDLIHDPESMIALFQSEEEGMGIAEGKAEYICIEDVDFINNLVSKGYHFFNASHKPVSLGDNAIPKSFWGGATNSADLGVLGGVQSGGLLYITGVSNGSFVAYTAGDLKIYPDDGNLSNAVYVKLTGDSKEQKHYEIVDNAGTIRESGTVAVSYCRNDDGLQDELICEGFDAVEFKALLQKNLSEDDTRKEGIDGLIEHIQKNFEGHQKWGVLAHVPLSSGSYPSFNGEKLLLELFRDNEIYSVSDFTDKGYRFFEFNTDNVAENLRIRGVDVVIANFDIIKDIPVHYNLNSYDYESFDLPIIQTAEELGDYLDIIEDYLTLNKSYFTDAEYNKILEGVADYRVNGGEYLATSKLQVRMNVMGTLQGVGAYDNYCYDLADLRKREELRSMTDVNWYQVVRKHEEEGKAIPITTSNTYYQYIAKYQTESAFYLGISYLKMMGDIVELNMVGDAVNAMTRVASRQKTFSRLFPKKVFDFSNKTKQFSMVVETKGFNKAASSASDNVQTEIRKVRKWAKENGYVKKTGTGSNTDVGEVWGVKEDGGFVEKVKIDHADNLKVKVNNTDGKITDAPESFEVDINVNSFDDALSGFKKTRTTLQFADNVTVGASGGTMKFGLVNESGQTVAELKRVPAAGGDEFSYYFTDFNGNGNLIKNQQYDLRSTAEIYSSSDINAYNIDANLESGQSFLHMDFNMPANVVEEYSGVGKLMFDDALTNFSNKTNIDGIHGEWLKIEDAYSDFGGLSVNLQKYQKAIAGGMTREQAAFETITGKWAKSKGYTKVEFVEGAYDVNERVEVIFRK